MNSRFVQLALALLSLGHGCVAETEWYDPGGQVGQCTPSDKCNCQFTGRWNVLDKYFELKEYATDLNTVEQGLQVLDLARLYEQTVIMLKDLDEFESRVQNTSVDASLHQYSVFEGRMTELAARVNDALQTGMKEDEILEYESRATNISISLERLWNDNPYAVQADMNEKVLELTGKLGSCQRMTDGSYFRGDSLPYNLKEEWCDVYEPVDIGDSLAHGTGDTPMGNWFKDPYPVDESNVTSVWLRGYTAYSAYRPFSRANNYSQFIENLSKKTWTQTAHNTRTYGLGYTMYNGSMYYHFGTEIIKYTISNNAIHKVALTPSNIEYLRHATITRVDMKSDEYGLYAIYADAANNEKLVVTKINPQTLERMGTWNTNRHKSTVCATFMICGKLYTLDNCWSRLDTQAYHKQYTFDFLTGDEAYEKLHLTAKFGHIWMVGYNARERLLFAWDNGHLVTYPIIWKRKTTGKQ